MSNHTLDASGVKVCSRCGETKSIKDFYVRKKGLRAGQVRSSCKMCEAASHAEYRRAIRQRMPNISLPIGKDTRI